MSKIDYKIAKQYFSGSAKVACGLCLIITIIFIIGIFTSGEEGRISCIIFTLVFGLLTFFSAKGIKELSDVLEEINNKIRPDILNQALNSLGLDIEQCNIIDPVIMGEDAYSNIFSNFSYNAEDDFTSNHRFLVLLFSENQLLYYNYTFSLISDEENIISGEFFYKDIVGFKIENKEFEFEKEGKIFKVSKQTFTLMTTGGTAFETPINKSDEEKIQGMRQLLREKKNAMN